MSLIEAQFVGTTCIAPRNSAIPEVLGTDVGNHLVPNASLIEIALDNGHKRPIFDVRGMVSALEEEYKKWLDNDKKKVYNEVSMERAHKLFQWQDKRDKLLEALLD
jgi:glycosyltransferase involved in cell wall biosynthesis